MKSRRINLSMGIQIVNTIRILVFLIFSSNHSRKINNPTFANIHCRRLGSGSGAPLDVFLSVLRWNVRRDRRRQTLFDRAAIFRRSCPQAASMSRPFSRLSMAGTPRRRRAWKKRLCCWAEGRRHCNPATRL